MSSIKHKQPCLRIGDLFCYTFSTPFMRGEYAQLTFDMYLTGFVKRDSYKEWISILASFDRTGNKKYALRKHYVVTNSNSGEALLFLNAFLLKYARRYKVIFENTGMQDELS